jgi:hypothetical protein
VLLTLPALIPLARSGFFASDDGTFHVYRLAALDRSVRAGVLYPRWFPELAFGYGHPVLNFYGPLGYYWGLPFTLLGANAVLALWLVFATGLVASALAMFLFARLHLDRGPALVAAIVYAYLPYHLADLYVRGAVAEFLAFVWLPLVLWAFHKLLMGQDQDRIYRLGLAALTLAALVVTHSLSAFIFAPVLIAYVLILSIRTGEPLAFGRALAAVALAAAVSAFYWLPVLTESGYVGLGYGASQGYQDHLLSWPNLFSWSLAYPYPSDPSAARVFPLGWVQVLFMAASLAVAFRPGSRRWVTLLFLGVALLSTLMLTATSLPIWQVLERGLAFLQYPWRFQLLVVLATAFLAGAIVQGLTRPAHWSRVVLGSLMVLFVGVWALMRLSVVPSSPDLSVEAMWQMDRDHGQVGTTWTGEYLPVWVTEQRWALSHAAVDPVPVEESLAAGQVKLIGVGHTLYRFAVSGDQETKVSLHQFYYPGWEADDLATGQAVAGHPEGNLGLASFSLPTGAGSFSLRLNLTHSQKWGTLVSLAATLLMAAALLVRNRLSNARIGLGALLLAVCYLLLAAVLGASLLLPNGVLRPVQQVNANLEDTVELLAFTTDGANYQPGDTIDATLYWRALRSLDQGYKTFVHMTDVGVTRQPAQHDGDPSGGFSPTTRWLPGEMIPDTHHLVLPTDLEPGRYLLWAGMYEYDTVRNLSIVGDDGIGTPEDGGDGRVLLGEIEVAEP